MSGLEDVYDGASRWREIARAALLLAGSLVAAVGFVAATASLVAGFGLGKSGALKVAATLGGVLLLAAFLVVFARQTTGGRSRVLAGIGVAVALAGLVAFWTTLPTGWEGRLAGLPPFGVGAYAVGLLAVFGAGVTAGFEADARSETGVADSDARVSDPRDSDTRTLGGVESVVSRGDDEQDDRAVSSTVEDGLATSSAAESGRTASSAVEDGSTASPAVGDGGEDEDDLQFFDGDEES